MESSTVIWSLISYFLIGLAYFAALAFALGMLGKLIGYLRTPGSHRRESLMPRRIKKSNLPSVIKLHTISPYMLCYPAMLSVSYNTLPDPV